MYFPFGDLLNICKKQFACFTFVFMSLETKEHISTLRGKLADRKQENEDRHQSHEIGETKSVVFPLGGKSTFVYN